LEDLEYVEILEGIGAETEIIDSTD
jgi:hypothetical protein